MVKNEVFRTLSKNGSNDLARFRSEGRGERYRTAEKNRTSKSCFVLEIFAVEFSFQMILYFLFDFRYENSRFLGFGWSDRLDIACSECFQRFRRFLKESASADKSFILFYKKLYAKIGVLVVLSRLVHQIDLTVNIQNVYNALDVFRKNQPNWTSPSYFFIRNLMKRIGFLFIFQSQV